MDMNFLKAFGTAFGILAGSGLLYAIFKVGLTYGTLLTNVNESRESGARTELTVASILPRVQTIEQTLHGPEGNNGLYSSVKEIERRLNSGRRVTDRGSKKKGVA